MPKTVLTVFLSSTGKDLDAYRTELHRQITGCDLLKCVRMEDFGPQDANAVDYCQKAAREADIFIGVIGLRRGWEPKGDNKQRSITEMEYEASKEHGRPRFIAIAPADFSVPGDLRESDEVDARQVAFRYRVGSERIAGVNNFKSPDALASEFMTKLLTHVIASDLILHIRPDLSTPQNVGVEIKEEQAPAIAAAFEKLAEDQNIDLLAMARNPQGIDIAELEGKLIAQAEQHAASSLDERRKAAEYWRHVGALAYLNDTQKALSAFRQAVELDPDDPAGWNELGQLLERVGDLDQAVDAFSRVLDLGEQSNDNLLIAVATSNLGIVYRKRGDLDQAEKMCLKSLALEEQLGRTEGKASDYGNLGIIYETRGDLDRAEEMYRECLALNEALGRNEGLANQYGNLGNVYRARGDLDQAEEMYRKSLALDEAVGRKEGMAKDYGNLGIVYHRRGDLDQAEEFFRESLMLNEALGRKEGLANQYGNLGNVYRARGDIDQAEGMYRKSLALNEALAQKEGMARGYGSLGILLEERGEISQAISFWQKARDIYAAVGIPHMKAKMEKWISDASNS